jgi:hypothetical protein
MEKITRIMRIVKTILKTQKIMVRMSTMMKTSMVMKQK